jgi:hypothetical protein
MEDISRTGTMNARAKDRHCHQLIYPPSPKPVIYVAKGPNYGWWRYLRAGLGLAREFKGFERV